MSSSHGSHDHGEGSHKHGHAHPAKPGSGLQRHHLFMLFGVGLMLLAMIAYVFTLDEAVEPAAPGAPAGAEVPADAPVDAPAP